jgi:hypothetical protein
MSLALVVRFLLELAALAALASAGIAIVDGPLGWLLGLGLATLAAVAWGLFVAPRARYPLTTPARLGVEIAVFVAATVGLLLAGRPFLAALLLIVYALDRIVLWASGAPSFEPPTIRERRPRN